MNSRALLILFTLVFTITISWQLRWVILILFGSAIVSVALDVLIQSLSRKIHTPRPLSLLIVLLILVILGTCILQLVGPELITQIKELGNLMPDLIAKLKEILSNQSISFGLQKSLLPEQISWDRLENLGSKVIGLAGGAANSLIQFILITLLAILLVLDPDSHKNILISLTPKSLRTYTENILNECRIALGGWLVGMTISAISIFILTWAGLSILGVPLALLSSLIAGLLTFVPIIGPTTATLLPLGISLIISPTLMVKVLIFRLSLQNLEAFILTPLLLRRTVNLLPTVALVAQLILGTLLGLPGFLLALPLAIVMQVILKKILVDQILNKC